MTRQASYVARRMPHLTSLGFLPASPHPCHAIQLGKRRCWEGIPTANRQEARGKRRWSGGMAA